MPPTLIPVVAIVCTFAVPIVAILVHHQRKMAELIHQNHAQSLQPNQEVQALRHEIAELRQLMNQQTIAMDDLRSRLPARTSEQDVATRFSA